MFEIQIPKPIQIVIGDVGWWCGKDGHEDLQSEDIWTFSTQLAHWSLSEVTVFNKSAVIDISGVRKLYPFTTEKI